MQVSPAASTPEWSPAQAPQVELVMVAPASASATAMETVLGRRIQVDTTAEIIAKKVWHRGRHFTARDLFDLALVAAKEPAAIERIAAILRERRDAIRKRIASDENALRKTFAELDTLEFRPSFDECLAVVAPLLDRG